MIDIDFFDEAGRFRPTKIIFSPSEDVKRASSRWTRMFGGLMALHGKIWAKSYLTTHFQGKNESDVMLSTIRKEGQVRKADFMKTVAECTLRYETLSEAARVKGSGLSLLFDPPHLKNLPHIVFDHIASIDWQNLPDTAFSAVTAKMADNICRFIDALERDPVNDVFVDSLRTFSTRFRLREETPEGVNKVSKHPAQHGFDLSPLLWDASDSIAEKMDEAINAYTTERNVAKMFPPASVDIPNPTQDEPTLIQQSKSVDRAGLHAALTEAIIKQKSQQGFKKFGLDALDRCGIIGYLKFGECVFSKDTDFVMLERILAFKEEWFKEELEFLSDAQIQQLVLELQLLRDRLPGIKSAVRSEGIEESEVESEGWFSEEKIDSFDLEDMHLQVFKDWHRLSEGDLRKLLEWVRSLEFPSLTKTDEGLVRNLLAMAERLGEWVGDSNSGRAREYPHLERTAKALIKETGQFLKELQRHRATLARLKDGYKNKSFKRGS